jgi:hypothetical protein
MLAQCEENDIIKIIAQWVLSYVNWGQCLMYHIVLLLKLVNLSFCFLFSFEMCNLFIVN